MKPKPRKDQRRSSNARHKSGYDALLWTCCVEMGFCGGTTVEGKAAHVSDYIPDTGFVTAEQFVSWLLIAEVFHPETVYFSEYRSNLVRTFVDHMGGDLVDVVRLKPGGR